MSASSTPKTGGKSVVAAGALNTIARVMSQLSQLVIFILAARLLEPADFGIFALVSAVAVVLFRISQAGWPEFIMAWNGEERVLGQVMMVALISGMLAMGLGFGASGVLHVTGGTSEIVLLAALFAVWIPLSTLAAAQSGILVRSNRLSASALNLMIGEAAGFAVSVWALLGGEGVLALVYGRLVQQIVYVSVGYALTLTLPRFGLARATLRDVLSFFWRILLSRVATNMSSHVVTFLIGGFLGPAAVGFFRAASRITSSALEVIGEPARVMAWARFRGAAGSKDLLAREVEGFYIVLVALALPVFLWITVFSNELTVGLLGPAWVEAAPLVAVLGLSQILQLPAYVTESVASLTGQLRRLPGISLLNAAFAVIAVAVAAPFGIWAVAVSQIVVLGAFCISHLWLQGKSANIVWWRVAVATSRAIAGALLMAGLLTAARQWAIVADMPPLVRVLALTLPAVPVYLAMLLAFYPELRPTAARMLMRVRRARATA